MARTSATRPYTNKKGVLRISVLMDYALALRIATGDLEALDEIAKTLTRAVEISERKSQDKPTG